MIRILGAAALAAAFAVPAGAADISFADVVSTSDLLSDTRCQEGMPTKPVTIDTEGANARVDLGDGHRLIDLEPKQKMALSGVDGHSLRQWQALRNFNIENAQITTKVTLIGVANDQTGAAEGFFEDEYCRGHFTIAP